MDREFRPQKSLRITGLLCLLFFVAALALTIYLQLTEGLGVPLFCFSLAVWGFMACLSVWILLACWRESLIVRDGRFVQNGIWQRRELGLDEITELRWRIQPMGGRIVLRSPLQTIKIELSNFVPEERRWLIRLLRHSVPESRQYDWERFCLRIALPQVRPQPSVEEKPLEAGEVMLHRRRIDWLMGISFLPVAAASAACAWLLRTPRPLSWLALQMLLWLWLRFQLPHRGLRTTRLSARGLEGGPILFLLVWCAVTLAVFVLVRNHRWAIWIFFGFSTVSILPYAFYLDRRQKAADDAQAPAAVAEWDQLETPE